MRVSLAVNLASKTARPVGAVPAALQPFTHSSVVAVYEGLFRRGP